MASQVMGLTDGRADEPTSTGESIGDSHPYSEPEWKSDVALEMWIDTDRVPASVRLTGTIGRATGVRLLAVIAELIDDGLSDFELCTKAAELVDAEGAEALHNVQRLVAGSGGSVTWCPSCSITKWWAALD